MGVENGGGRKGRFAQRRQLRPIAEINITPMVDVMLVLLVIFMVTAPLMTSGVPVDLPASGALALEEMAEPLIVTLNKNGELFLQETPVSLETLMPRLHAITGENAQARIYIRADRALPYGQIMEVMGLISGAGFGRVALVSETVPASVSKTRKRP